VNVRRQDEPRVPPDLRIAIPGPVRLAGWIASAQGLIGVGIAVVLLIRAIGGHREETVVISGYGTAVWFAILGGGLLAAGLGLLRGRRWGRGLVVIAELLLLFVAWYVGVGSHQYLAGIALAVVCASALVALFRRDAVEWYAA
jgi:peptidoglycan/LPS O-acetylase OafA/YrhL